MNLVTQASWSGAAVGTGEQGSSALSLPLICSAAEAPATIMVLASSPAVMVPPRRKPEVDASLSAMKAEALLIDPVIPRRSRMVLSYSSRVSRRMGAGPGTASLSDSAPAPGLPSGPTGGLGPLPGSPVSPGPLPPASSPMLPVQPRTTRGAPRRHHTLRPRDDIY